MSTNSRYHNNSPFSNRGDPFLNGRRGCLLRTTIRFLVITATVIHHTRAMKVTTNQFLLQIQTHIMMTITLLMKTLTTSLITEHILIISIVTHCLFIIFRFIFCLFLLSFGHNFHLFTEEFYCYCVIYKISHLLLHNNPQKKGGCFS